MSLSATTAVRGLPHDARPSEPTAVRVLSIVAVSADVAVLATGLFADQSQVGEAGWDMLWWSGLVAVVGLAPMPSGRGPYLVMDLPLLLGGSFVFGPVAGGLIAAVGCWDLRELRREISLTRSLLNRAQTSLSVMAAAWVFQAVGGRLGSWPSAVGAAVLAVLVDIAVNYLFVGLAFALPERTSILRVMERMRLGSMSAFAASYLAFGFLGLLLAEIYLKVGIAGLLAFASPIVLAHRSFSGTQRVEEVSREIAKKQSALQEVTRQVGEERRDERQRIAASLHDDVVQSLYNVSLYANVIRENLRSGRLLQLDEDLPMLLRASESASDGLRRAIKGLRESPLGRDGLARTTDLLARELAEESGIDIDVRVRVVELDPDVQLAVYQVAREALVNAVKHSGATRISVDIEQVPGVVTLSVQDDGLGWRPEGAESGTHVGIQLMRERVELRGGSIGIESRPNSGTRVRARFPLSQQTGSQDE